MPARACVAIARSGDAKLPLFARVIAFGSTQANGPASNDPPSNPGERIVTKTDHPLDDRWPLVLLLVGAILAPLAAYSMLGATERDRFTLACARLDLNASSVIEERGRTASTPTAWLANAGLNHLQARSLCLSGEEEKAVILYRRIIDGDMSLSHPWMTK